MVSLTTANEDDDNNEISFDSLLRFYLFWQRWLSLSLSLWLGVEAKFVTHSYYNSSMKSKFHNNTRLVGKIIEKTSLIY